MRDYKNIDRYITKLYQDIYEQPEDAGHTRLAQTVIDFWMSKLTSCTSVLDVGAGQGFCQPMFESWDVKYEGVALGEDVIKAKELGRNVKRMDFSFLDYPDDSFDLVFSRHSLEHSPMPILTLMEWARVSKSWLGLVMPAPEWYTYAGHNHYSVANTPQIENWLHSSGWNIIWKAIDSQVWDKDETRPHEYWIMAEKKQ